MSKLPCNLNKIINRVKSKLLIEKRDEINERFIDYFFISEITEKNDANIRNYNANDSNTIISYRYPEKDRKDLFLPTNINLFSFPITNSQSKIWNPPISFHFALTISENRVFGTSLIFWSISKHLNSSNHLIYKPSSITILSRFPYLDQFSVILKQIYHLFFSSPKISYKDKLDPQNRSFYSYMIYLCSEIPIPTDEYDICFSLIKNTSNYKNLNDKIIKEVKVTPDMFSRSKLNNPLIDLHEEGIEAYFFDKNKKNLINKNKFSDFFHTSSSSSQYESILALDVDCSVDESKNHNFNKKLGHRKRGVSVPFENRRCNSLPCINGDKTIKFDYDDPKSPMPFTLTNLKFLNYFNEMSSVSICLSRSTDFYSFPMLNINLYQNLFSVMDTHTIVKVFCCVMCEMSIIFYSTQISILTRVQECFRALLFPFRWSHIYIPQLPNNLYHIIEAPVPFMVGVHKNAFNKIPRIKKSDKDILFVDIDTSTIESYKRIPLFPYQSRKLLINNIRKLIKPDLFESDQALKHNFYMFSPKLQLDIRKTFLHFIYNLLGNYREFLHFSKGRTPFFNTNSFLANNSKSVPFLSKFLQTYMFTSFMQMHLSEPALLEDYLHYLGNSKLKKKKKVYIPLNEINSNEKHRKFKIETKKAKESLYRKSLLEKNEIEKQKQKSKTRVAVCINSIFTIKTPINIGVLISIADLLKIIDWRESFLSQIINKVIFSNPKNKIHHSFSRLSLNYRNNDYEVNLPQKCYEDLLFLLNVTLDECNFSDTPRDYSIVKKVLDISFYIYKEKIQESKIENIDNIINVLVIHPMFHKERFWKHVLINEIKTKFIEENIKSDKLDHEWCFQMIIKYAHQMVDLDCFNINLILNSVDSWCIYCELSKENKHVLKETVKNLYKSKDVRLNEIENYEIRRREARKSSTVIMKETNKLIPSKEKEPKESDNDKKPSTLENKSANQEDRRSVVISEYNQILKKK